MTTKPAADTAQMPLKLFVVTLDWNPNDSEEGDYCEKVWAVDESDATQKVSIMMADTSELESDAERGEFVRNAIANAGPYAVECVADRLLRDVRDLLGGAEGEIKGGAETDFNAVAALLQKYGVNNPWAKATQVPEAPKASRNKP